MFYNKDIVANFRMRISRGSYFLGIDFYHIVRYTCYGLLKQATIPVVLLLAISPFEPVKAVTGGLNPPPLIGFRVNNGIPYTEINVRATPGAEARVRQWTGGALISPVFDIDGRIVVDFRRAELIEALGLE